MLSISSPAAEVERVTSARMSAGQALHAFFTGYVRFVTALNRVVGNASMYLLLVILGVLSFSICAKAIDHPAIWVMETAQFAVAAYYLLGAGYSLQHNVHVRMDFLYERWSPKVKASMDCVTALFVIFYLVVMVIGGWASASYALEYGQRNHTAWAPYMAPIKIAMTAGMFLMLLQVVAEMVKDVARVVGKEIKG